MPKPYDSTLNSLLDAHAVDWPSFLAARSGVAFGPVESLDTDLSATLQADRLFRVMGPTPAVLHLELESSGRLGIPDELLRYNIAARSVLGLSVHSTVILLRPKATATDLSGWHEIFDATGSPYLTFRYTVIRLWQEPLERLLNLGVGIAPLALLTNEAANNLPAAFGRFYERLRSANLADSVTKQLVGYSSVLWGLRYDRDQIRELFMSLDTVLQDSSVYQDLLSRGEVKGSQTMLLKFGIKRLGVPSTEDDATLKAVNDLPRLQRMADRILDVINWNDLLATP